MFNILAYLSTQQNEYENRRSFCNESNDLSLFKIRARVQKVHQGDGGPAIFSYQRT